MAPLKRSSLLFIIIVILFILSGCILQKKYDRLENGDLISAGRDTIYYKINSKLALSDDAGGGTDYIKWIPEKMDMADDAVDYGTECYSAVFDKIYCGDDYVVIKLIRSNQYIVIDCNKSQSECLSTYDDPNTIEINYLNYPVINCLYPNELRQFN